MAQNMMISLAQAGHRLTTTVRLLLLLAFFVPFSVSLALAEEQEDTAGAMTAEKILASVDRNLYPESCDIYFQVVNQLPNGRKNRLAIYAAKGRDRKAAAVIVSPDELKGRSVLRLGEEVWMHIPGELELRRTSLTQSVAGSVFNNADLLQGDFGADYKPVLKEESKDAYVLELTPRSKGIPYAKMVLHVDRKLLVPLTLEQYGAGGELLKKITFEQLTAIFGVPRPEGMRTASKLNPNYVATLQLGTIRAREFTAEAFTKDLLPKVGLLTK